MDRQFEQEMKNMDAPALTLNLQKDMSSQSFSEPMWGKKSFFVEEDEETMAGSESESMLSEAEKKQVEEFVDQIDISNVRMVDSYGSAAQNGITAFSKSITGNTKAKEFGDVGQSLRELRVAISSTVVPERKGILGFFQKGKQKVTYLISNYENAESSIQKIEKDLQKHRQILMQDVYMYDEMYKENIKFYKSLTMYIIAGKKALRKARATRLNDLRQKADYTHDQLDIQEYRDYDDACKRFEKRIADLETTRMVSIQMAPQIRLLQNSDQEMADKLRSDVLNTIPLWRNQMVLALGIEHSRRALDAQSAVTEMTNEMFRRNAETLKQGAIDAAIASEKGIVDIETLKKVNADIITSINEVVKIHEDGSKRRAEAQIEMAKIEDELKQALLEAGAR